MSLEFFGSGGPIDEPHATVIQVPGCRPKNLHHKLKSTVAQLVARPAHEGSSRCLRPGFSYFGSQSEETGTVIGSPSGPLRCLGLPSRVLCGVALAGDFIVITSSIRLPWITKEVHKTKDADENQSQLLTIHRGPAEEEILEGDDQASTTTACGTRPYGRLTSLCRFLGGGEGQQQGQVARLQQHTLRNDQHCLYVRFTISRLAKTSFLAKTGQIMFETDYGCPSTPGHNALNWTLRIWTMEELRLMSDELHK